MQKENIIWRDSDMLLFEVKFSHAVKAKRHIITIRNYANCCGKEPR